MSSAFHPSSARRGADRLAAVDEVSSKHLLRETTSLPAFSRFFRRQHEQCKWDHGEPDVPTNGGRAEQPVAAYRVVDCQDQSRFNANAKPEQAIAEPGGRENRAPFATTQKFS